MNFFKKIDRVLINALFATVFISLVANYSYAQGFLSILLGFILSVSVVAAQSILFVKKNRMFNLFYFFFFVLTSIFLFRSESVSGHSVLTVEGISSCPTICNEDMAVVDVRNVEVIKGGFILIRNQKGQYFAKRVHGVPGDEVLVCHEKVFVNGYSHSLKNDWKAIKHNNSGICDSDSKTYKLNDGQYFVLGDNPESSIDSRTLGVVRKEMIVGRLLYKFGPSYGFNSVRLDVDFR